MSPSLELDIFEHLHRLTHQFRAQARSALEAAHPELTFNEMRVLMHTGRHPGLTHKDLIEHSQTDKAQMTRIITRLEDGGWITRTPSDTDKRVRCLHLSLSGMLLFKQQKKVQAKVAEALLQAWPEALKASLLEALQLQADALN